MKKILVSLAALLLATSLYAQDDKAAAKAAKEAAKAAKKAADAAKAEAMSIFNDGMKCYEQANGKFNELNQYRMMTKDQDKVAAKQKEVNAAAYDLSKKGAPLLSKAFATGLIEEKKFFEGYRAHDFMLSQLINAELQKASQKEPFDTAFFAKAAIEMCDACHYQLKYGKKSDDQQKVTMVQVEAKFPRLHTYLGYATQFAVENKDLEGACAAFDNYKNFANKYPEVAKDDAVKNPQIPNSQFAFNIYFTAYQMKRYDICEKFYDEALLYNDENSHNFVVSSRPQMYLQKGDTLAWANALKEMIDKDPSSSNAEVAAQNLLAYYSQHGVDAMVTFADELLAKNPNNKIANYGKGYACVKAGKYDEAVKFYEKCVEVDPEYVDGNYQCGFCYYQMGLENGRKIQNKKYKTQAEADKESESKVKSYLRKAAPYFEKVRELKPEDPDRWASELKVIYTNLKMNDKVKELPDMGF